MSENIIDEVEETLEEVFKPKPGGMVDTYRKEKARREEASKEREQADERIEELSYKAVKVAQISPSGFSINLINIPAGGNAIVLPASPYRYRATITVVTAASTVTLAKDAGAAISGIGFPLATGIPLVLNGRGILYGSCPNAIQVAVIAELYAPES